MNTDQYQRPAAERLHAATMGGHNLQRKPPGWTPPNEHAIPDRDDPLAHLDPIQHQVLFNGLLEDWDNPVYTELGLCRAHDIAIEQLIAMARLPVFQWCLENIRTVRAMRRPGIEAAAANTVLERLLYITQCNLDSAAAMKECRLAIKQITAILNPDPAPATKEAPTAPDETPPQRAPNGSEGMPPPTTATTPQETTPPQSTPHAPENTTPTPVPTSARRGAGDPSPASETPKSQIPRAADFLESQRAQTR